MKYSKEETKYDDTLKSFRNIKLTDQEKSDIHEKMMESVEKPARGKINWNIRPIISVILTGFLLFIGGYFLVNQVIFSGAGKLGQENEEVQSPYTEIEKEISGVLQTAVYIPYHDNLPVRTAMFFLETISTVDGEVIERKHGPAVIGYSNLEADQADAAELEQLKELETFKIAPIEIVYGDYLKKEKYEVSIAIMAEKTTRKELLNASLYGDKRTIAGHPVSYRVLDGVPNPDDKSHRFSFKLKDVVYVYTFPVKNVTEEDASQFVEKSLKQILKR